MRRDAWKDGAELVHPVRSHWRDNPPSMELLHRCPPDKPMRYLAENWKLALDTGLVASSTKIADQVGLSDSRVRQIVRQAP
ncbi:hypothetical protein [Haloferula rosea]|uniref:Uncharacterized protein n=1 Tax=Haloferula rosea TaxID=490093 RepID=A0A934R8Y6_9BACT|nr:hypothetical protein [Haloferula rosea]MBK1826148.1 hypothetical protein [Haloferula rosea]